MMHCLLSENLCSWLGKPLVKILPVQTEFGQIALPECLLTIVAGDNQSLQVICLNVLYILTKKAFHSDYFPESRLFHGHALVWNKSIVNIHAISVDLISR